VDVRVLAWAGAPLPLFHPDRREVREMRDELTRGTRIQMQLDANERPMHCHHEKLVLVDDRVAYVGGIDLTSFGGNRLDSSSHERRPGVGWHDACLRLEGPIVADVAEHYRLRWRGSLPAPKEPAAAGGLEAQLVRTVPEHRYDGLPRGEFTILESYLRALRGAERLVYLESQFLWSQQIVEILADKLRHPPSDGFRIVVLLPAKPNNGADSTRGQLAALVRADDGAGRFLATTISARTGQLSGPAYVHAKIGIVDDRWLTIGSANLNEHSLFNDTEMNIVCCEAAIARRTRLALWAEHLERSVDEVSGDPRQVVDELWRPIALEQRKRLERGEALTHRLRELPGVSRRSMALLGPLDSLVVDG
jgi:phosphatidylserine/phosphatidylglycerophosphate/cardiolipin synthase-like enzyme